MAGGVVAEGAEDREEFLAEFEVLVGEGGGGISAAGGLKSGASALPAGDAPDSGAVLAALPDVGAAEFVVEKAPAEGVALGADPTRLQGRLEAGDAAGVAALLEGGEAQGGMLLGPCFDAVFGGGGEAAAEGKGLEALPLLGGELEAGGVEGGGLEAGEELGLLSESLAEAGAAC